MLARWPVVEGSAIPVPVPRSPRPQISGAPNTRNPGLCRVSAEIVRGSVGDAAPLRARADRRAPPAGRRGLWSCVFVLLAVAARSVGPDLNDNLTLPGSDSQKATDLLGPVPVPGERHEPGGPHAPTGAKLTDSKYKQPIDDTVAAFKKDPDVRDATSPLDAEGHPSKDGTTGYIALNLSAEPERPHDRRRRSGSSTRPAPRAPPAWTSASAATSARRSPSPRRTRARSSACRWRCSSCCSRSGPSSAMGLPIVTAIVGLVGGLSVSR